jgi:hypothetical protein
MTKGNVMRTFGDFIFYFFIGMCILVFLVGCASSGPSAEPTACRGVAFPINPPSSLSPATTDQTAGAQ